MSFFLSRAGRVQFPKIFLKDGEDAAARAGSPWIFGNEINAAASLFPAAGAVCEVFTESGLFLGSGIYNPASKIAVRLLARVRAETLFGAPPDAPGFPHTPEAAAFFHRAVTAARRLRRLSFGDDESFRLVFAEADGIPGFTADRFVDTDGRVIIAAQFLSLASEVFRAEILDALEAAAHPDCVFERSDSSARVREGLEQRAGHLKGTGAERFVIRENGALFRVDAALGQKTGFYLDQKRNRAYAARFAPGRRVLDAFAHTGAFGICAALAGAREVVCCDSSPDAARGIGENAALNGAEGAVRAVCADAFGLLRQYEREGQRFDQVILDPSAFAKSARNVDRAYGGYKEINLRAMRLLTDGGILVSCSCSHYFDAARFYAMLAAAARDAGKRLQFLAKRGAAEDHPVLAGYPKSEYLKCAAALVTEPAGRAVSRGE